MSSLQQQPPPPPAPPTSATSASPEPFADDTMTTHGGASGFLGVQRTFYAAAAAPRGWAGHRLELRNGVRPYLAAAAPLGVAAASIYGGMGALGGSSGLADRVLDALALKRIMENGTAMSGGDDLPVEGRGTQNMHLVCWRPFVLCTWKRRRDTKCYW